MSTEFERKEEVSFDIGRRIPTEYNHVTEKTLQEIRAARAKGFKYREIAEMLGVSSYTINKAIYGTANTAPKERRYATESDIELVKKLRLKGYKRQEIVKATGLGEGQISKILKEAGMPYHKGVTKDAQGKNKQIAIEDISSPTVKAPKIETKLLNDGISILKSLNVREMQTTTAMQLGYALAILETAVKMIQEE